jgi:hypothetical protein
MLPRVIDVHGQNFWQPRKALTLTDAYDLWYGSATFVNEPFERSRQCCSDAHSLTR